VTEQVIPDGNTPSFGRLLDAAMLVCLAATSELPRVPHLVQIAVERRCGAVAIAS
jgi:hypothetical protein